MRTTELPQLWVLTSRNGEFGWFELTAWGVWCTDHQRWVATGPWTEREAYQELLAVDSSHPMRLEIRAYNHRGPTRDEEWVTCPTCHGLSDCPCCDRDCRTCDGTGEVGREDVAQPVRRAS